MKINSSGEAVAQGVEVENMKIWLWILPVAAALASNSANSVLPNYVDDTEAGSFVPIAVIYPSPFASLGCSYFFGMRPVYETYTPRKYSWHNTED